MNLLRGVRHFSEFAQGIVATIGNFDGVHSGHQSLLERLQTKAHELHLPSVVILFEPQPGEYFQPGKAPVRLSSLREKLSLLSACSIDYIYCFKFNKVLAQTSACEFARIFLFSMLHVKYLLVGEDFHFGKNREGNVHLLQQLGKEYSWELAIFPDFCIHNERSSSTKIRSALQQGQMETAARYLGRPYSICGRVLQGDARGRQWGVPTANLGLGRRPLALHGVFVVEVHIGSQKIFGVANAGNRPTVDGSKDILEVHLFDFNQSIYGEFLEVFFLHKVRDEVKFDSLDALIKQIYNDIEVAKTFVKNLTSPQSESLWQNTKIH